MLNNLNYSHCQAHGGLLVPLYENHTFCQGKGTGRGVATTIHSLRGRLATSLPVPCYITFITVKRCHRCEIHFMGVSP